MEFMVSPYEQGNLIMAKGACVDVSEGKEAVSRKRNSRKITTLLPTGLREPKNNLSVHTRYPMKVQTAA